MKKFDATKSFEILIATLEFAFLYWISQVGERAREFWFSGLSWQFFFIDILFSGLIAYCLHYFANKSTAGKTIFRIMTYIAFPICLFFILLWSSIDFP